MSPNKVRKHVIFLGAGASKGSGYPLANELRLRISSWEHFDKHAKDYESKHKLLHAPYSTEISACLRRHAEAIDLFRNGGFATLDEFCKLAGGFEFKKQINGLRCLVRGALGLCNPEESFHTSEYYGFVQSLFKDDLLSLREDVCVLTYNYDPYLQFLLHRALKQERVNHSSSPCVAKVSLRSFAVHLDKPRSGGRQFGSRKDCAGQSLFPLPGGEGQGEGERQNQSLLCQQ